MKPLKTKKFLKAFLSIFLAIFLVSHVYAQGDKNRGSKGKISKEELILELKKAQGKKGSYIDGYIVNGKHVVEIIKDTDYEIKIKNSIVENGLDFEEDSIITNGIEIIDSEIQEFNNKTNNKDELFSIYSKRAVFHNKLDFKESNFIANTNFEYTNFEEEVRFYDAVFTGEANFAEAEFNRIANFNSATFIKNANFDGAEFKRDARFDDTEFKHDKSASIIGATFSRKAFFRRAVFSGFVFLWNTEFMGEVTFREAKFHGHVYFDNAIFGETAHFSKAKFNVAQFEDADFEKSADFRSVTVKDTLLLSHVSLKKYADFRGSSIEKLNFDCSKSPTVIQGRLDFRRSKISEAHFQNIIFEKSVDFSDAEFGLIRKSENSINEKKVLVFKYVTFESNTNFIRTRFDVKISFESTDFYKDAMFVNAFFKSNNEEIKNNFSLSYLKFNNLIINWGQLPKLESWVTKDRNRVKSFVDIDREKKTKDKERDIAIVKLQPLSQVLKGLEENFRKNNQLGDVNIAYYHRINAELREGSTINVFWWIWWLTAGYGTKVWWVILWCVFFTLLFAFIYCIKGNIERKFPEHSKVDFTFKPRLFDFPKDYLTGNGSSVIKNETIKKFVNSLRFSSVILFKAGYRDTVITGNILGIDYRHIVRIEWFLGFYLLASLLITLSNTVPIIHWLIVGLF